MEFIFVVWLYVDDFFVDMFVGDDDVFVVVFDV